MGRSRTRDGSAKKHSRMCERGGGNKTFRRAFLLRLAPNRNHRAPSFFFGGVPMLDTRNRAKFYRDLAKECSSLATRTSSCQMKNRYLLMAEDYVCLSHWNVRTIADIIA